MNIDNALKNFKHHIIHTETGRIQDKKLWAIELFEDYLAHYTDLTKSKPDPQLEESLLTGELSEITEKELTDFLHVFCIKKIASRAGELKSYLVTLKDFLHFLQDQNEIEKSRAKVFESIIEEASELPLTAIVADLLFKLARSFPDKEYTELVQGHFCVNQRETGFLVIKDILTGIEYSPVIITRRILSFIRTGMILHLEIVKTETSWEIVEAGNVYLKFNA